MTTNYLKYCRSCGISNPENITSLSEQHSVKSWQEIFFECTGINVQDDNFSKILCKKCTNLLEAAYKFRTLTHDTYNKFLKGSLVEDIKNEAEINIDSSIQSYIKEEQNLDHQPIKQEETETILDYWSNDEEQQLLGSDIVKSFDINKKRRKWIGEQCPGCKASFQLNLDFKKHLSEMKGTKNHQWHCYICSSNYMTKQDMYGHMIRSHKECSCAKCDKICLGTNDLNRHMTKFHNGETYRKNICPHCGKIVKNLRVHIQVHKKEKKYECHFCDKKFVTKHRLLQHLQTHSNNRPHQCSISGCGKSFKQLSHLKQHEERHGPRQTYMCDICGLYVSSKYYLIEHRKQHYNIGTYKCDECKQSFAKPHYLKEHKKNQHVKYIPVICPICGRTFKNSTRLNAHIKIHEGTEHICKECNKMFLKRSQMLEHISATHEKTRKYFCQWVGCDKVYLRRVHLRRHEKKYHLQLP